MAFAGGEVDPDAWRTLDNCVFLRAIPSSNALAREIVDLYFQEDQAIRPTVLVAESQPGAYGRSGRAWSAPAGKGLYFTVIRKSEPGEPLSLVPIAAARWISEVLREKTGVAVELKWPNDLYVGGRKLAGVVSESRTQGEDTYLAIGFGINVRGSAEALGVPNATTLEQEADRELALAPLLQAVLDRLDRELAAPRWEGEVRAWERASLHRPGDRLTVRRNGEEVRGEYLGLDPAGFLRLKTDSGETVVSTGELSAW